MTQTLKYKTFKSTEDFEAWQEEVPITSILNVMPVMLNAGASISSCDGNIDAAMSFGVFVLYQ